MINTKDMMWILEDAALSDGILIYVGVDLSDSDNLNWLVKNEMLNITPACSAPDARLYTITNKGKAFLKKRKDYEARR